MKKLTGVYDGQRWNIHFQAGDDTMSPRCYKNEGCYYWPDLQDWRGITDVVLIFKDGRKQLRSLVKRTPEAVTVEQYNPPLSETICMSVIDAVYPATFTAAYPFPPSTVIIRPLPPALQNARELVL